ncbi:MAG: ResB-like family, partial [Planctomycetota bacterium]
VLFVYSSIGSAGIVYPDFDAGTWDIFNPENWAHDQLRQWRNLEMTEFEWFHWWPFDLMMILISINIVVTTLRRIPFKPVNYGVWGIHAGIIVLVIGSFIYFGLKVEGDTPVARRKIVAEFDAAQADGSTKRERVEFVASPGQRVEYGEGVRRVMFEVRGVDPSWELLTGDDKGKRTYSVTVAVERDGKRYMRQLLAGYPQLTEDLILTDDQAQPMKRAVKETGKPIFDEGLAMNLEFDPQEWFYLRNDLAKSWALYVRPKGSTTWTERPIHGLPLYNDYIGNRDDVYQSGGEDMLPLDPIDIAVGPVAPDDPFRDVTFRVNGYLRYAIPRSRVADGGAGAPLNPMAMVEVSSDRGQRAAYRLVALDPQMSKADEGLLRFVHLENEQQLARYTRQPAISVRIPAKNIEVREIIREVAAVNPNAPFVEIKGSEIDGKAAYAYRVVNVQDNIPISGGNVAIAILEVRTPKGLFRRWVFDNPALTRDVTEADASDAHGGPKLKDDSIDITFDPGNGLALVLLAHGPEEGRLRLVSAVGTDPVVTELKPREVVPIGGGVTVRVEEMYARGVFETKPLVVPKAQRQRDAMETFAQVLVAVPGAKSEWMPFTRWVFDTEREALRRAPFEPRTVRLADGREVEMLFSRQRLPLKADVALDEFVLSSHVGGFTGAQGSIRDYKSRLRFRDDGGAWSDTVDVSVNNPAEHKGLWFFQAQWDPPDSRPREGEVMSAGLNYTVLGVGNREGVYIQLLGCCIAVAGMIYAFYVKPVIKRRRQAEVLAKLGKGVPQEVQS